MDMTMVRVRLLWNWKPKKDVLDRILSHFNTDHSHTPLVTTYTTVWKWSAWPYNACCHSVEKNWSTWRKLTHAQGEHVNSSMKGRAVIPSQCEAPALMTVPPCRPKRPTTMTRKITKVLSWVSQKSGLNLVTILWQKCI